MAKFENVGRRDGPRTHRRRERRERNFLTRQSRTSERRDLIMALLKGKTAVITGGSTGIGLATAKRFVEEGAYVFINGRSQAELDAAVKEIGGNVTGVLGDGGKQGDRDRLYTAVADTGRRLDVVFANAAAIDVARIGDVTQEHLQKARRSSRSRQAPYRWPLSAAGTSTAPRPAVSKAPGNEANRTGTGQCW
jgi:FlaA1/EpsC-like NDP-sugar epimerase